MNLGYRVTGSVSGNFAGGSMCFLYEKRVEPSGTESTAWFASGVMVAASVWSLLIPSIDMSEGMGKFAFFTGSNRIYIWNPVFTADGQNHSASSYE